jgi:hypothetical protein
MKYRPYYFIFIPEKVEKPILLSAVPHAYNYG